MGWFDTHCHLDFLDDPRGALAEARAAGVERFVVPGVTGVSAAAAALAANEPGVLYTVGVHPLYLDEVVEGAGLVATLAAMRRALTDDPRCVGVGEVGLDYQDRPGAATRERQRVALRAQLALAAELGCPVVVHLRKGWDELLAMAVESGAPTWILHMFSGSPDVAAGFVRRLPDVFFGFGGPATRQNARKPVDVLRGTDPAHVLLETDAPDLAPPPLPPPNRPSYLPWIGSRLAAVLGVEVDALAVLTAANAARAFGWKPGADTETSSD